MIRKLKKKFILINMLLAALVLNVAFITIGITSYQRLASESRRALASSFSKSDTAPPPKKQIGSGGAPPKNDVSLLDALIFKVKLSDKDKQITVTEDNVEIEDEVLKKLVAICQEREKKSGIIAEYRLRYMVRKTNENTEFAFYDLSSDIHTMSNLLKNFLVVEIGSLIAFYIISRFLAKWALKPVERSWQQQKQFVADASHELKTPLTVILANTDILISHKEDTIESQFKWLNYIQAEAVHMGKLVSDLLFLANADALREKINFSKINISDILWNCYLPFEPVAFEQGKVLDNTIDSDIYIQADEGKLKQLILILLDNACKYTQEGGNIHVKLIQKQDKVHFLVTNSGNPIPAAQLPHIFERFYRADESRTRESGGYGLGLSIAKAITDMLEGKITVTSSAEIGTAFCVIFNTVKN